MSGEVRHQGLAPRKIELVEASFARVEPRARAMAIAFYEELFLTMPTLRPVFPRDDQEQRRIALSFAGFVVANLRWPDRLALLLERMGARGMLDDLTHEEVDEIGKILLMVLRQFEGNHWTLETSQAWAAAFVWTVGALRRGSEQARYAHAG